MLGLKFTKKGLFYFLILSLFVVPSVYSLVLPGFFLSDDGEWMVIRFSAFYQALVDGQFPVRFLGRLNQGYGYPVANFLYPGFMYLAVPLQILGAGFVNSIKIIMFASMLGGGAFTFSWLSKLFDKKSALVGSIFFVYAPYHLFDLYKRGSVGEILAIGILPFILWQIERNSIFWVAVGIFLLILAHNSLAILFLLFILGYMCLNIFVSRSRGELIPTYIKAVLAGIGMASFFWIPAFYELRYTFFSSTQISEWANYFADINLIGFSTLAIFGLIFMQIIFKKIKIKEHRLTMLFLAVSLFSTFLASSLSSPVWNFLPASFIQFPFRFLSLLIPSVAFLAACAVSVVKGRSRMLLASALVGLAFFSSLGFLFPKVTFDKGDSYYSTNEATTTVKDEYMPVWVKEKPSSHFSQKVEILDSAGLPNNLTYNSKRIYFETSEDTDRKVRVNTLYYPGWQAKINGRKTDIIFDNPKGIMEVNLPKGKNIVEFKFSETPLRLLSDLISAAAFGLLIIWSKKRFLGNIFHKIIK